jgi:hypothetical protein
MAEFVLGLTKTAVEGTVSRVQKAIEEEANLKEKVLHDLVFITGEFQMMQSFLNIATKERARNEVVRTWVRQLRDLAFDVEDCVEFVVHLHLDRGKSLSAACLWRAVVPSCMAPPRPLDEAAAEIELLKARVEDVSQRNTRYNLIISDDSAGASSSKAAVSPSPPVVTTASSDLSASAFQILRQVWVEDAGSMSYTGDLRKLINREGGGSDDDDPQQLQVISLWGGSDNLGVPYIINKAYHDPEICQRFTSRAWVKMTRPFNPDDFLNTLLTQLMLEGGSSSSSSSSRQSSNHAAESIQQLLTNNKEQRYLVVLEHVSEVAEWNAIRKYLPDNNNGSRIVVSTQDLGIALLCPGRHYLVSELQRFPSLCAFHSTVIQQTQRQLN